MTPRTLLSLAIPLLLLIAIYVIERRRRLLANAYVSLLASYDAIHAEHERLKLSSEVVDVTEFRRTSQDLIRDVFLSGAGSIHPDTVSTALACHALLEREEKTIQSLTSLGARVLSGCYSHGLRDALAVVADSKLLGPPQLAELHRKARDRVTRLTSQKTSATTPETATFQR